MQFCWRPVCSKMQGVAPGYTSLNTALVNDPSRSEKILDRIPAGRWGKPEASNYLSGAIIPVDGGYMGK